MRVAYPIYDVVFKYLMGDQKAARIIISHIIEETVESIDFSFSEFSKKLPEGGSTALRMDFSAKIRLPEGGTNLV